MAVGNPDFSNTIRPEKPFWGAGQNVAIYYSATPLLAGANATFTAFTCPAGWNFAMSSAVASCDSTAIQRADYRPEGVLLTVFHWVTQSILIDSDIGAGTFTAGQRLDITLYNNDAAAKTIYVCIWGNMQQA